MYIYIFIFILSAAVSGYEARLIVKHKSSTPSIPSRI